MVFFNFSFASRSTTPSRDHDYPSSIDLEFSDIFVPCSPTLCRDRENFDSVTLRVSPGPADLELSSVDVAAPLSSPPILAEESLSELCDTDPAVPVSNVSTSDVDSPFGLIPPSRASYFPILRDRLPDSDSASASDPGSLLDLLSLGSDARLELLDSDSESVHGLGEVQSVPCEPAREPEPDPRRRPGFADIFGGAPLDADDTESYAVDSEGRFAHLVAVFDEVNSGPVIDPEGADAFTRSSTPSEATLSEPSSIPDLTDDSQASSDLTDTSFVPSDDDASTGDSIPEISDDVFPVPDPGIFSPGPIVLASRPFVSGDPPSAFEPRPSPSLLEFYGCTPDDGNIAESLSRETRRTRPVYGPGFLEARRGPLEPDFSFDPTSPPRWNPTFSSIRDIVSSDSREAPHGPLAAVDTRPHWMRRVDEIQAVGRRTLDRASWLRVPWVGERRSYDPSFELQPLRSGSGVMPRFLRDGAPVPSGPPPYQSIQFDAIQNADGVVARGAAAISTPDLPPYCEESMPPPPYTREDPPPSYLENGPPSRLVNAVNNLNAALRYSAGLSQDQPDLISRLRSLEIVEPSLSVRQFHLLRGAVCSDPHWLHAAGAPGDFGPTRRLYIRVVACGDDHGVVLDNVVDDSEGRLDHASRSSEPMYSGDYPDPHDGPPMYLVDAVSTLNIALRYSAGIAQIRANWVSRQRSLDVVRPSLTALQFRLLRAAVFTVPRNATGTTSGAGPTRRLLVSTAPNDGNYGVRVLRILDHHDGRWETIPDPDFPTNTD